MSLHSRTALIAWLAIVAASAWWTARHVAFTADLTAFLPASSGRLERLLVEQLREGVASRTMLIAIEGGAQPELARLSRELARALSSDRRIAQSRRNRGSGRAGLAARRLVLGRRRSRARSCADRSLRNGCPAPAGRGRRRDE